MLLNGSKTDQNILDGRCNHNRGGVKGDGAKQGIDAEECVENRQEGDRDE